MAFVRVRGNSHALIETYREGSAVRQRVLANLGPLRISVSAIEANPEKFGHLASPCVGLPPTWAARSPSSRISI